MQKMSMHIPCFQLSYKVNCSKKGKSHHVSGVFDFKTKFLIEVYAKKNREIAKHLSNGILKWNIKNNLKVKSEFNKCIKMICVLFNRK